MIKHTADTVEVVTKAPPTGIWRIDDRGNVLFSRYDTQRRAVESEEEAFFFRITKPGDYRYKGADLGILVTRGRLMTSDFELNERAKAWIRGIKSYFKAREPFAADTRPARCTKSAGTRYSNCWQKRRMFYGQAPLTNDTAQLTPQTTHGGPVLEFDFPEFRVGIAEYVEGPTGCTVFHFPYGAVTAVDVRGGSPKAYGNYDFNHAICLAGGSVYGLEAAAGVTAELFAMHDYSTAPEQIAHVSSAICFDLPARDNAIYPDKALGRAALRAARPDAFPLGAHGAGCSAMVGKCSTIYQEELAGQGGAFRQLGPTKIAVFTVVNAVGAIVDRRGKVVRGYLDPATGTRRHLMEDIEQRFAGGTGAPPPQNTTLTVLVTNQQLAPNLLTQIAGQVHDSMCRGIQPFHTTYDGDVLYAITTDEVQNPALDDVALGTVASEVAWDAILSSVHGP